MAGQRALDLAQRGQSVRQVVFAQRLLPLLLRGCALARLFRDRVGRGSVCFFAAWSGAWLAYPLVVSTLAAPLRPRWSRHRLQAGSGSGTGPTPSVRLPWGRLKCVTDSPLVARAEEPGPPREHWPESVCLSLGVTCCASRTVFYSLVQFCKLG